MKIQKKENLLEIHKPRDMPVPTQNLPTPKTFSPPMSDTILPVSACTFQNIPVVTALTWPCLLPFPHFSNKREALVHPCATLKLLLLDNFSTRSKRELSQTHVEPAKNHFKAGKNQSDFIRRSLGLTLRSGT